ncbi:hypothetical protein K438DRAFT_1780344 [Mycena galopus ATCC 62051]|nr:hypothetical protein K438DRAFT_1780344 [Mycena galopus ATCC 62051]
MFDTAEISLGEIKSYRSFMVGGAYIEHSFFSLDNMDSWISPVAFPTYMNIFHGSFDEYHTHNTTPSSPRAPPQAVSSLGSRTHSRADSSFSRGESRPGSCASFLLALCAPSPRSSSPFGNNVIEISSDSDDDLCAALPALPLVPKMEDTTLSALEARQTAIFLNAGTRQRKGKQKADEGKIQITRQESVDQIVEISTVPSTWPVPHTPTAYLISLSNSLHLLKRGNRTWMIEFAEMSAQRAPISFPSKPSANQSHSGDRVALLSIKSATQTQKCDSTTPTPTLLQFDGGHRFEWHRWDEQPLLRGAYVLYIHLIAHIHLLLQGILGQYSWKIIQLLELPNVFTGPKLDKAPVR